MKQGIDGGFVWCRSYLPGEITNIIETPDHGFIAVGYCHGSLYQPNPSSRFISYAPANERPTHVRPMNPIPYNPTSGNLTQNFADTAAYLPSTWRKGLFAMKVNSDGLMQWAYLYGREDLTPSNRVTMFNETTEWADIVYDGSGFIITCEINGLSPKKTYGYKIDANGMLLGRGQIGGDDELYRAIVKNDSTYYVSGIDESSASAKAVLLGFKWTATGPSTTWSKMTFNGSNSSLSNKAYEHTLLKDGRIALAYLEDANWIYSGFSIANGVVMLIDPTTRNTTRVNLGKINAYDLQLGITSTQDGGFAAVSSRGDYDASGNLIPLNVDDPEVYSLLPPCMKRGGGHYADLTTSSGASGAPWNRYWNTDAVVFKVDSSGNIQWERKFDSPGERASYPGDLKKQECVYKILEDDFGDLVIAGNSSHNLDDGYMAKLSSCQDLVFESTVDDFNGDHQLNISSNTTWNTDKNIKGTLRILRGKTLTIDGAKIQFGVTDDFELSKVIVEPGAHLLLKIGAELTSVQGCSNNQWLGVYVAGNPAQAQYDSIQGKISVLSRSKISNARDAITTINIDQNNQWVWGTQGGIIYCNNAIFENNRRDVQLLKYYNSGGPHRGGYMAEFYSTTFSRNNNFHLDVMLPSTTLWSVQEAYFDNCTFTNTNTGNFRYKGGAILSHDGTMSLDPLANGHGGRISGYASAIRVQNFVASQAIKPIIIRNVTFSNVMQAVYLSAANNAQVLHNTITLQIDGDIEVPASVAQKGGRYGIYLDATSTFTLHNNVVKAPKPFITNPARSVGIVVKNSGASTNEVYGNELDGLNVGIEALGENRDGGDQFIGLLAKCNQLGSTGNPTSPSTSYGNIRDLLVTPINPNAANVGIAQEQGSPSSSMDLANNLFSPSAIYNIQNQTGKNINYYYSTANRRFIPNNVSGAVTPIDGGILANPITDCQPRAYKVKQSAGDLHNNFKSLETSLSTKRQQLDTLLNGGSTAELEADILFASNQTEYQKLYIEIMDMAPYVDEEMLLNLLQIDDYPELALRNIFVANPHAARSSEVLEGLYSKKPSLSQQTLNDIKNQKQTITAYDVLLAQMGQLQAESERTSLLLLQAYAKGEGNVADSIKTHLKARDEAHFRYMLVEQYIQEENYTQAQREFDLIPTQCSLSKGERVEHNQLDKFYKLVTSVLSSGEGALNALSSSHLDSLQEMYENGTGVTSQKANNLLTLNGVETGYIEPLFFGDEESSAKTEPMVENTDRPVTFTYDLRVYPNPSSGETITFTWDPQEFIQASEFHLSINDMVGRRLMDQKVKDLNLGMKILDVSFLVPGTYILQLSTDDGFHQAETLIIQ
ncbi:MAG: T9SS type A sorting domain-containing protein [Bacteroidetes bacterium]|nr:MAG: T9SS type A sorting domain-containing protein [Bacteroidota bacterium]